MSKSEMINGLIGWFVVMTLGTGAGFAIGYASVFWF